MLKMLLDPMGGIGVFFPATAHAPSYPSDCSCAASRI